MLRPGIVRASQGYLILAMGAPKYLDMAAELAISIRVMDPGRRICMVHDENAILTAEHRIIFDDFSLLPVDAEYPGFMCKIRVFDVTPYAETMVIDADCLMVKHDIDRYWDLARQRFFSITGDTITSGAWKGIDVAATLAREGAPYLVQMNSGVFYFDGSDKSRAFFAGLNRYYLERKHVLGIGLHRGQPAQTDELYLGLYMGLSDLDAANMRRTDENSWMVSTWRAVVWSIDPAAGRCVMYKPRGNPLNPLHGWDRLSPTLAHFIGLKPRRLYNRLCAHFRRQFDRLPQTARAADAPTDAAAMAVPVRSEAIP